MLEYTVDESYSVTVELDGDYLFTAYRKASHFTGETWYYATGSNWMADTMTGIVCSALEELSIDVNDHEGFWLSLCDDFPDEDWDDSEDS